MSYTWQVHLVLMTGLMVIGCVVGSFLNVCIYRMPLEKSVIWPDSRCPKCLGRIGALENIPILSWLFLGASCRTCKLPISPRYPMIEAFVGGLFVLVYLVDAQFAYSFNKADAGVYLQVLYHCVFVAVLVVISFIDYDWTIVPAGLTNFGICFGLMLPLFDPSIRPAPASATTSLGAIGVGVLGAAAASGIVWVVRFIGGIVFRREAVGEGDIHILALVGAFMGWQAAVLTFFLSAFYGLIPSLFKLVPYLRKRMTGREWNASDREIPLGPFLCLAAFTLLIAWHRIWPFASMYFETIGWLVRYMLGLTKDES